VFPRTKLGSEAPEVMRIKKKQGFQGFKNLRFLTISLICSNKLSNIYDIKGRLAVLSIKKINIKFTKIGQRGDSKIERLGKE